MATIREDNIIVTLEVQGQSKTSKALEETRDQVLGIEEAAEDMNSAMISAFEDDVIKDYIKVLQEAGEEIGDIDQASEGIRNRLRSTFDTSNPDKYASSLAKISLGLATGEINSTNFVDALDNLDGKTQESERSTSSFFSGLASKARTGFAAASSAIAIGAAAIAASVVTVFSAVGAGIGAIFGRAIERVPSVRENFERLQDTVTRIGDYIASNLAPIFIRLIEAGERFVDAIDLTAVLDGFNAFFITLESITEQFAQLFGFDVDGLAEGLAGVFNFLFGLFTEFNRQAAGFRSALFQLFGQIRVFLIDFSRGTLQAIDAILPGRQFDEAILNLGRNADRIKNELFPSIGAAFQAGINEFDQQLEEARANYEDFDLFRGFDEDVEKLDQTLQAAVGSIQFYRDQITQLRADADRTAPEVSARLLDIVEDLEQRLGEAEREIQIRFEQLRGIITSPLADIGESDVSGEFDRIAREQAQEYADALIAASKALANEEIAPQLREIAENVQSAIDTGEFIVNPNVSDTIKGLREDYEDTIEVIERLEKVYVANSQRRAAEAEAERQRTIQRIDDISTLISSIDDLFNQVADSFSDAINRQIDKLDDLVAAQEDRVDRATTLAERGNAEILQLEEQRLDRLLQARERALDRERQLAAVQLAVNQGIAVSQGIVAVTRAFAEGNIIGGIAASAALAGSLAAIVITLTDAFSNIPTFFTGTERVDGHRHKMSLIGVHGGERIFKADHNSQINPSHSNARVLELYKIGRMIEESPISATVLSENGIIDPSNIGAGGGYDYKRLESLLSDNTKEIKRLAKQIGGLSPSIVIPRKDIHGASQGYQNKLNRRKAMLK